MALRKRVGSLGVELTAQGHQGDLMSRFRIKTEQKTESELGLCAKCSYFGRVVAEGRELRLCGRIEAIQSINRRILQCDYYLETGRMSLHEAEKVAWIIDDNKKGKIGFAPPSKDFERYDRSDYIQTEIIEKVEK
jgi:hypothetical protein